MPTSDPAARRRAAAGTGLIITIIGAVLLVIIGFAVARAIDPRPDEEAVTEALAERVAARLDEQQSTDDASGKRLEAVESALADQAEAMAELAEVVARLRAEGVDTRALSDAEPAPDDAPTLPAEDAGLFTEPPIAFDPSELDFGFVPINEQLTGAFTVRNVTEQPVRIAAMKSDCACTTVEDLAGRVLEPGESVELTAVIDPRSYPGPKRSKINFVVDDYRELIAYTINSNASRAVYMEPSYLGALDETKGVVRVASIDGEPFRILATDGRAPDYVDFDLEGDEPRAEYHLRWDLSGYDPVTCRNAQGREMPGWWVLETDHPDAPVVDAVIRHGCTRPELPTQGRRWVLSERRAVLDEIPSGDSAEFEVELEWMRHQRPSDTIQRVESESPDLTAELVDVRREGDVITATVRITPDPDRRGLLYGDVRLYAYNPDHSSSMAVIARVVEPDGQARAKDDGSEAYMAGPPAPPRDPE